nr:aldo/keto reductase [uncultured Bacteroides sp.]
MEQTIVTLNDGNRMPQFGFGVYLINGDVETKKACLEVFKAGYRHIDTAHAYQNERGVGAAVKESGLSREDIWITSKLWPNEYGKGKTANAINKMLSRLDTDYIDLLLLHQQFGDYIGAWQDMENAVSEGKVKSIGLSNFESERLEDIFAVSQIKPAVLQVECHPYYQQNELKKRLDPYRTILESWYPIGHGDSNLINEPIFTQLAKKYDKTNVKIILRWHIQENNIIFPKSTNLQHIKDNIDIFDFSLSDEEVLKIKNLDKGKRFFNMSLTEQEKILGSFIPAD